MSKWKASKTHHVRRFQPKRTSPFFSAHFLRIIAPVKIYFCFFFRIWHLFDIRIIQNCIKLMFWRLGTMLERFFKAKSFGLHISNLKRNMCQETQFLMFRRWLYVYAHCLYAVYVSWLCIVAMYHGYVSWLCIMAMSHGYVSWLSIMAMYHGYVYYIILYYIIYIYYVV